MIDHRNRLVASCDGKRPAGVGQKVRRSVVLLFHVPLVPRYALTLLWAGLVLLESVAQPSPPIGFLIVKPGDSSATPRLAGEFLSQLGDYLVEHVPWLQGRNLNGGISNQATSAVELLKKGPPLIAFVPAGFYLQHLHHDRQARPVAMIPRFGTPVEHYYLVTPRKGPSSPAGLKGQTVATLAEVDLEYLKRVVFSPDFQPGSHFRLKPTENLADELFLMLEESGADNPTPPSAALLLDEELKNFFEQDDLLWPDLKILWKSEALPRDLVVVLGSEWTDSRSRQLQQALMRMNQTGEGRKLLDLMNSSGLTKVNRRLLDRTARKYFASRGQK